MEVKVMENSVFANADQERAVKLHVAASIKVLRKHNKVNVKTGEPYLGVHVRWSKFNDKLRKAFPTLDAIECVKELERQELVATVAGRGGPTIYLFADRPAGYRPAKDETAIDEEIANQIAMLDAESILASEPTRPNDSDDAPVASNGMILD
jgi:hypothetical protein